MNTFLNKWIPETSILAALEELGWDLEGIPEESAFVFVNFRTPEESHQMTKAILIVKEDGIDWLMSIHYRGSEEGPEEAILSVAFDQNYSGWGYLEETGIETMFWFPSETDPLFPDEPLPVEAPPITFEVPPLTEIGAVPPLTEISAIPPLTEIGGVPPLVEIAPEEVMETGCGSPQCPVCN
jgi:hypothetical protein